MEYALLPYKFIPSSKLHSKMDENYSEMYSDETAPVNEARGFTTSFQKRTKDKKEEDVNVRELLTSVKQGKATFGSKVAEKSFKKGVAKKVYTANNCDDLTLRKLKHYAKLAGQEIVELDLDNDELAQKLGKPFLISTVCVRS